MQKKSFLKQKKWAAKLDDIPTREWQIYWFVALVTTLTGFSI